MKIQELAKLAGVSPSTVSRVFANNTNVRPEIREKVRKLARDSHYHPRLSRGQKNVVVITPYNAVYPVQSCVDMLLMALMQELPARDFRLEVLPVNNLDRLDHIPFCAAAAIGVEPEIFQDWDRRFDAPLLLLDRSLETPVPGVFEIVSDIEHGVRLAVEHLYERNCRNVGCIIHGDPGTGNADLRYEALKKVMGELKLPAAGRILFGSTDSGKYVELTGKLLKLGCDALFCPGGNAGIVMLYALSLYGKRVPEDVSLIASEQSFFSRYAVPPQTTISPDYAEIGRRSAALIEDLLENRQVSRRVVLPYQLIVRESVRNNA